MPTRRKRKKEETALSKAIRDALAAKGCRVWRIQSGMLPVKYGEKTHYVHCAPTGSPDLLVIVPGESGARYRAAEYVHVEVKAKDKDPSEEQLAWAKWASESGVRSVVVRGIQEAIDAVFGRRAE